MDFFQPARVSLDCTTHSWGCLYLLEYCSSRLEQLGGGCGALVNWLMFIVKCPELSSAGNRKVTADVSVVAVTCKHKMGHG